MLLLWWLLLLFFFPFVWCQNTVLGEFSIKLNASAAFDRTDAQGFNVSTAGYVHGFRFTHISGLYGFLLFFFCLKTSCLRAACKECNGTSLSSAASKFVCYNGPGNTLPYIWISVFSKAVLDPTRSFCGSVLWPEASARQCNENCTATDTLRYADDAATADSNNALRVTLQEPFFASTSGNPLYFYYDETIIAAKASSCRNWIADNCGFQSFMVQVLGKPITDDWKLLQSGTILARANLYPTVNFTLPPLPIVTGFLIVNTGGYVGCRAGAASHWGCEYGNTNIFVSIHRLPLIPSLSFGNTLIAPTNRPFRMFGLLEDVCVAEFIGELAASSERPSGIARVCVDATLPSSLARRAPTWSCFCQRTPVSLRTASKPSFCTTKSIEIRWIVGTTILIQ